MSGTLTWSDGGTGNPRTINTAGTYTVTQTTGGCTSAASNAVTTAPFPVPAAPVLSVINNCGSSTITVTGVTGTLTWSDGGIGNPRTVNTAGTYTVTQTSGGCTSAVSNSVTTAPLLVPATPGLLVTDNCGSSTITVTGVSGTLTWSDGGTGNPRTINIVGTYTVTQTSGGCTSAVSNSVTTAPLPVPAAPVLSVINNLCGNSTITANAVTGTLTWTDGGTGNPRIINIPGTYTATQTLAGCTSAASNSVVATPDAPPVTPTATVTVQPNCNIPTGTIVITAPTGSNLEYSINGTTYQPNTVYSGLNPGNYNISARFAGSSCSSLPVNLNVITPNLGLCGLDIYFPTAFTPNGDGINDEFGPGPLSNLVGITDYALHVYNRYGELVFFSRNPYKKWDGKYKGRLSGNMNYVWQAEYKRSNGAKEFQKGSISIIK